MIKTVEGRTTEEELLDKIGW